MRQVFLLSMCLSLLVTIGCSKKEEKLDELITDRLNRSVKQYVLMADSLMAIPDRLPKSLNKEGKLHTSKSKSWTSGFFPGTLWYLYEYTLEPKMKEYAITYTNRLEKEKDNTRTHDLGFMLYCSYGNGLRLVGDTAYNSVLLTGAESLTTRYNEMIGCIKSWNSGKKWQYPVIIDNMMNLEYLFWASKATGNPKYKDISISHIEKTITHHFRPDYSTYHVVSYDTITGQVEKKVTAQGYSDESSWARGQAWALYGFTMVYRETQEPRYLEQAKHIAEFILNHPNLPEDKVPYWDFNAPDIPGAKRDASSASVIASALIELSQYVTKDLGDEYLKVAERQIRTLSSPEYFAEEGTNGFFILKHSVGSLPAGSEIDVPLSYADYYYIEAMLRMKALLEMR